MAGGVMGIAAGMRRGVGPMVMGAGLGALVAGIAMAAVSAAGTWLFEELRGRGPWAGLAGGVAFSAVVSYLFGVLGIAFFGFLFRPSDPPAVVLRGAFGRGAAIVAALGASFGGIAGILVVSLRNSGLLP